MILALQVFASFVLAAMLVWVVMLAFAAFGYDVAFYVLHPAGLSFIILWIALFYLVRAGHED